jgi:hypothetical protein
VSRARLTAALGAAAVAVAAALAAGYAVAGPAGTTVVAAVLAVFALLAARGVLGRDETPPPVRHRGRPRRNWWRERRAAAAGAAAGAQEFPAYRRIAAELSWAAMSRRHYDHAVRPILGRLALRLAAGARATPGTLPGNPRDPRDLRERARAFVGEDLWPLADTSAPPSDDSHAPGVPLAAVAQVVSRLESAHRAGGGGRTEEQ